MTDLKRLKVSLTKHGAHKLAKLLQNFDKDHLLQNLQNNELGINIDLGQTKKILSGSQDRVEQIPELWNEVRDLGSDAVNALVFLAIIFSHHELIQAMIDSEEKKPFEGTIIRNNQLKGKVYTNFAHTVHELGFSLEHDYGDYVRFHVKNIFEINNLHILVVKLFVLKLEAAGWEKNNSLMDEVKIHRFHEVFSITQEQFDNWLTSGNLQPAKIEPYHLDISTAFPPQFPANWAVEWGEDGFGLFMVLEVKGVQQRFRWLLPGTFLMGSPKGEPERLADRETQHRVVLSQGFWLAETACTQALWQSVTGENLSEFNEDENNPVENVSWHDAQAFILKLNALFRDLAARLPTEAEWEYACRAGTVTPFSFGENISPEQVNYNCEHPYNNGPKGLYRGKTVPVKSLPANPWGLYEMHGNVWEWCQDWFGDYGAAAVGDPLGPETGSYRVLRGGAWRHYSRNARSAYRSRDEPDYRSRSIGFRLALGRGASR